MTDKAPNDIVAEMATRHGLSPDAVRVVLTALQSSGGGLAQFNHPDLGGMGQWSGGMTMIGDMFNDQLRAKVGALAADLSDYVGSSRPGDRAADVSYRASSSSGDWWPSGLGAPASAGAQNGIRYAVFPEKHRLVIEDGGKLSIYDSADHVIGGVGQQQGSSSTLTFTSQHGLVRVSDLKRVDA